MYISYLRNVVKTNVLLNRDNVFLKHIMELVFYANQLLGLIVTGTSSCRVSSVVTNMDSIRERA